MKYLKKFKELNESVGVPQGLIESSQKLYDLICDNLTKKYLKFEKEKIDDDLVVYQVDLDEFNLNSSIRDYEVGKVKIGILVQEYLTSQKFSTQLVSTELYSTYEIDKPKQIFRNVSDNVNLNFKIITPWKNGNISETDIVKLISKLLSLMIRKIYILRFLKFQPPKILLLPS